MCVMPGVYLVGQSFTGLPAFKDKAVIKGQAIDRYALRGRELVGVMCMGSFNSASSQGSVLQPESIR